MPRSRTIAAAGPQKGWYHGWTIVAVTILSQVAASGLPINTFSLFLQDWSADLNTSVSTLQLGMGSLGLVCALFSPVAGLLADKYPARWLFAGGLGLVAFFHLAVSFATSAWQVVVLYAGVLPLSLILCATITSNALVSRWFVRRLGLALGLSSFGLGMAGVIFPPVVAYLMPLLGWRAIWRLAALVIAAILVPLMITIIRDRPTAKHGLHYLTADNECPSEASTREQSNLTWRIALRRKNFWLILAVFIPTIGLYGTCLQNIGPIAASQGLSQQVSGTLLAMLSLAHLLSNVVLGALSDRIGNRVPLMLVAFAAAIGAIFLVLRQDLTGLSIGMLLVGFGGGLWPIMAAAVTKEFGSAAAGRAFGIVALFGASTTTFPFIVAKLHEATGSYAPGFSALAGLAVVGGICGFFIRENGSTRAIA